MSNQPLVTALRYAVSAIGAVIAAMVALGYVAQADADRIVTLLQRLSEHGGELIGIVGALASAASAAYGAYRASNAAHVARVEQTPGVRLVVVNPNIAPAAIVAAAEDPRRTKVEIDPRAPERIV